MGRYNIILLFFINFNSFASTGNLKDLGNEISKWANEHASDTRDLNTVKNEGYNHFTSLVNDFHSSGKISNDEKNKVDSNIQSFLVPLSQFQDLDSFIGKSLDLSIEVKKPLTKEVLLGERCDAGVRRF